MLSEASSVLIHIMSGNWHGVLQVVAVTWSNTCPRYHESQQLFKYIMYARILRFWLRVCQRERRQRRRRRATGLHLVSGTEDGALQQQVAAIAGSGMPGAAAVSALPKKLSWGLPGFAPEQDDTSSLGRRALQQMVANKPLLPHVSHILMRARWSVHTPAALLFAFPTERDS